METASEIKECEVWHRYFNLDKRDNLDELPRLPAVFGVFATVNNQAINCRYVGEASDLRSAITSLFENPPEQGLRTFLQGPWIKVVRYEFLTGGDLERTTDILARWREEHKPNIDDSGEYPGYYDYKSSSK